MSVLKQIAAPNLLQVTIAVADTSRGLRLGVSGREVA